MREEGKKGDREEEEEEEEFQSSNEEEEDDDDRLVHLQSVQHQHQHQHQYHQHDHFISQTNQSLYQIYCQFSNRNPRRILCLIHHQIKRSN